jgi:hypothetical protein
MKKLLRQYSLQTQHTSNVIFNPTEISKPNVMTINTPTLYLDTGRQFTTIPSLFRNKPETISFLRSKNEKKTFLRTKIQDLNPYFKMGAFNYFAVRVALLDGGFKRISEGENWNVFFGRYLPSEHYKTLNPFQKVNHFPGSSYLGRKDLLAMAIYEKSIQFKQEVRLYFSLITISSTISSLEHLFYHKMLKYLKKKRSQKNSTFPNLPIHLVEEELHCGKALMTLK